MKIDRIAFPLLAGLFLVFSCQRDIDDLLDTGIPSVTDTLITNPPPPPPQVSPDNEVVTSLQGKVLDEHSRPIMGAEVTVAGTTVNTDKYGIFRIADVAVAEHYVFVKVNKQGYFPGSRTMISRAGGNSYCQIKMIPKKLSGSFSASLGASMEIMTHANVQFLPNAIVTSAGLLYTGNVKVFAAFMDPAAPDFTEIMPGDLRGINADSQAIAMKSFGMLTVSIESESGEQLKLAEGKPARIRMKTPAFMISGAPPEMPLWHFSEVDGRWREEGKATLENGGYVGDVSHFSTWNCDMQMPMVNVTLTVKGFKGRILPYAHIRFTDSQTGWYSDAYTDSAGYLNGWAPNNGPLIVEVLNECNGVIFSQTAGPFNQDTDLGTLNAVTVRTINISGTVTDCDGQPATTGKATLFNNGLYYTTEISDGEYHISINNCETSSGETVLYITDPSAHYISEIKPVRITGPNVDGGSFSNCNLQLDEYVFFKLGADSITLKIPPARVAYDEVTGDDATQIQVTQGIYDLGNLTQITVEFYSNVPHIDTLANSHPIKLMNEGFNSAGPLVLELKETGDVGEEMYFTFSGMYRSESSGNVVPLKGEMRIVRRK